MAAPVKRWTILVGVVLGLVFGLAGTVAVKADHGRVRCGGTGQQACILETTAFIERVVKTGGDATFCFNAAARAYPGFVAQITQVSLDHAAALNITAREVSYPADPTDKSCRVRHDMLWNHPCMRCGAHIHLTLDPMIIEYNAQAGYSLWYTTGSHELGHGECALDEHYDKVAFRSFYLTFNRWIHGRPTTMDTGTHAIPGFAPEGIRTLTDYDLDRCEETLGFSLDEEPEPQGFPFWDGTRWQFANGTAYKPSSGTWERLISGSWVAEWSGCGQSQGEAYRQNLLTGDYLRPGSQTWIGSNGVAAWSRMPAC